MLMPAFAEAEPAFEERLPYIMIYRGLPTARAELCFRRGGGTVEVEFQVRTRPLFDRLYKIDNWYRTVVDGGRLLKVEKRIEQRNFISRMSIDYDFAKQQALAGEFGSWKILPETTSLLAMLADLRLRNPQPGETLSYLLDIESRLWRIDGRISAVGRELEVVFLFTPLTPAEPRQWKTDLLNNRLAGLNSRLIIRLGPPPNNLPVYIAFGGDDRVEMKLER